MNIAGSANSGTNMIEPVPRLNTGSRRIPANRATRIRAFARPAGTHRVYPRTCPMMLWRPGARARPWRHCCGVSERFPGGRAALFPPSDGPLLARSPTRIPSRI